MNITYQPEKASQKPKFKRFLAFLMSLLVFLGAFGLFKPENVLADTTININPVSSDFGNPSENYNICFNGNFGGVLYICSPMLYAGHLLYNTSDYNKVFGYIRMTELSAIYIQSNSYWYFLGIEPYNNYVNIIHSNQWSSYNYIDNQTIDLNNYYIDAYVEYEFGEKKNGIISGYFIAKIFKEPKAGGTPELIFEQELDNLIFYDENQNPVIDNRIQSLTIWINTYGAINQGLVVLTKKEYPELSIELPQAGSQYQASNPSEFVAAKIQRANALQNPYGTVLLKVLDVFNQQTYYWRDFWTYYDSGGGDTLFWIPAHSLLSPGNYEIQAYFIDDNIGYPENNQSNYPYLTDADFMAYAEQNGLVSEPVDFTFTGFYTTATPTPTPPVYPSMSPYPSTPPELSPPPYAGSEQICQSPPGGFLDYPVQNLTYAICQAFTFLFLPSENQRNNLSSFLNTWSDNLKKKPPFGYFYLIKSAFSGINTTATSTEYNFEIPVIGDTLKQAIIFLFWLIAVAYVIFRIKSIL